jgi:hypothetical protein
MFGKRWSVTAEHALFVVTGKTRPAVAFHPNVAFLALFRG